jgi:hypothetical protein
MTTAQAQLIRDMRRELIKLQHERDALAAWKATHLRQVAADPKCRCGHKKSQHRLSCGRHCSCVEYLQADEVQPRPKCSDCKNEIDPDVCHCGDAVKDHTGVSHNHSPVPMGCQCGREGPEFGDGPEFEGWKDRNGE